MFKFRPTRESFDVKCGELGREYVLTVKQGYTTIPVLSTGDESINVKPSQRKGSESIWVFWPRLGHQQQCQHSIEVEELNVGSEISTVEANNL